jgi:hypothetical protein
VDYRGPMQEGQSCKVMPAHPVCLRIQSREACLVRGSPGMRVIGTSCSKVNSRQAAPIQLKPQVRSTAACWSDGMQSEVNEGTNDQLNSGAQVHRPNDRARSRGWPAKLTPDSPQSFFPPR